ncbi:bifunctional acetyl-CoA hydrolase/transferase family protein/GNAT family N-acetyltransferase [Desulfofustis glycolicus]|uniref:Acyl-CoA hydrolase n=1 Tax=Desulfofustis glycolicus DSM 9705 TaxID=1121409 RepID=A0A1M5W8Y8_9BACT|nr:bifunctional acetyl-CoA hydrolase/transferase family protein/GNAT family N-acetyltransferase [Desulfofustis glycolicus]MCB2217338.1 GNAT family N-acetyltransferase [Desulfobulbaceae bacterium]SHH83940.1 Acyl-CoA hydrolase [Desulfofustis glycolicus DSM 9705]
MVEYEAAWQEKYQDMIMTPNKALSHVKSGNRVFLGTGCGEPLILVEALVKNAKNLADVEIVELLTKGEAPYTDRRYADTFKVNSFFIGGNVRTLYQEGRGDYTPILMYDIPALLNSGQMPLDVALIQVTPPDTRGKMSLGISVDIVKSAAENASLVIAQVNPQMPWTRGDSLIDVYDLDILVPVDVPLIERKHEPVPEVTDKIAQLVAALVPNGATIEFGLGKVPGFGRLPLAVVPYLKDKVDLGIHTELISDEIMELIEAGAVTGMRKTVDRGKVIGSFCMGSRALYDYIDDNPLFSFRPTQYVNDANVIGKHNNMVTINMALQIDLTGQVSSDSEGGKFYSGIGGQVDFNRGAARSSGGRPIVVMPSTDIEGASRIVSRLSPGSGVVISRGTVHYVVTEYGSAYLRGKSVQDRTLALISIAHPDVRPQLLKEAIEAKYIREEFADIEGKFVVASQSFMKTKYLLKDGTEINFRPIHPTDEPRMRDLLYDLSRETIYYRFMSHQERFGQRQIQNFVYIDHRKDVAIVGVLPEAYGDEIIAVGRYYLDERSNRAEVAFVVRDKWQNRGLGTFVFRHLVTIAKANGISGFTAEVLRNNNRMQAIFNHSGLNVTSTIEEGVYSFVMDF